MTEVLTIGHSTLSYERFLTRLQRADVSAVADVRTSPFSRSFPHFNRDNLRRSLSTDGIAYVFLGDHLGGRPKDKELFHDGVADYEKMAETPMFAEGIVRVQRGSERYRIALMCSERHPIECHRCLLVGRALSDLGVDVRHIVSDDGIVTQTQIEMQLLRIFDRETSDMFMSDGDLLASAYRDQSRKVAFAEMVEHSETQEGST